jgi:hypothetical protein
MDNYKNISAEMLARHEIPVKWHELADYLVHVQRGPAYCFAFLDEHEVNELCTWVIRKRGVERAKLTEELRAAEIQKEIVDSIQAELNGT